MENMGCENYKRFLLGIGTYNETYIVTTYFLFFPNIFFKTWNIYLPIVNVHLFASDFHSQITNVIITFILVILFVALLCGCNAVINLKIKGSSKISIKIISRLSQFSFLPSLVFVFIFLFVENLSESYVLMILFMVSIISLSLTIPILSIWISEGIIWLLSTFRKGICLIASRKLTTNTNFFVSILLGFLRS